VGQLGSFPGRRRRLISGRARNGGRQRDARSVSKTRWTNLAAQSWRRLLGP
jgi:hypothetical protein